MQTTVEDRIFLCYKAARKRFGKEGLNTTSNAVYHTARVFKIPCKEVRRVVQAHAST